MNVLGYEDFVDIFWGHSKIGQFFLLVGARSGKGGQFYAFKGLFLKPYR